MNKPLAVIRPNLAHVFPADKPHAARDQLSKYALFIARVLVKKEIYEPARRGFVFLDKFKRAAFIHRVFGVGADK